jgi:hypothetical protein
MSAVPVDASLDLHDRGMALLPLAPRGKRPHYELLRRVYGSTKTGHLLSTPASAERIRDWHAADPELNIGVVCGQASGGLVVVDIDAPAPASFRHPPTPTVAALRGPHLYARTDKAVASRTLTFGELRGEGEYVVAPPSSHPDGGRYVWTLALDDVAIAPLGAFRGLGGEGVTITPSRSGGHRASPGGFWALYDDPAAVARILPVLGIAARVGRAFRCVLPGHSEREASASIDPRSLLYVDFHGRSGRRTFTLPEVFAAQRLGHVVDLRGRPGVMAAWAVVLAAKAGLPVARYPMILPPAPTPSERVVADTFGLLFARNLLVNPQDPAILFVPEFVASLTGVSEKTAWRAISRLRECDGMRRLDGTVTTRRGHEANRYMPGDGSRKPRHWRAEPGWGTGE